MLLNSKKKVEKVEEEDPVAVTCTLADINSPWS